MASSRPRTHSRILALGGALALALASCSSGGGEATVVSSAPQEDATGDTASTTDTGATTTEDEDTTTTEGTTGTDEDAALAEAVALDAGDFTGDWEAEAPSPDDEDLFDCLIGLDREEDFLAEFDSDAFTLEVGPSAQLQVSSTGVVLVDAAAAEALLDEVASEPFALCAQDQYAASFDQAGVESADITLDPAPGVEVVRDQTSVLNGSFTFTQGGEVVEGAVSLWLVRTGAVVSGFAVTEVGQAGLAATVDEAAATVSEKHEAEVG